MSLIVRAVVYLARHPANFVHDSEGLSIWQSDKWR